LVLQEFFLLTQKNHSFLKEKNRYKIKSLNGMMILDNNDISNGGLL
jgi:hypothetical protein